MQWSPLRLWSRRWKAVYLVGGWLVGALLVRLVGLWLPELAGAIVGAVYDFAWIYFATRIFRGGGEMLNPARPWWRMTAKPRAGFVVGALLALVVVAALYDLLIRRHVTAIPAAIENAILAWLFLNSSLRLRRASRVEA